MKKIFIMIFVGLCLLSTNISVAAQTNVPILVDKQEATENTNPTISSNLLTAKSGEIVTIPVQIQSNCGLMGYNIKITYDKNVFTPISVEQGEALSGGFFNDSIETSKINSFNVIWSSSENQSGEGLLFNLLFSVADDAVGDYEIELGYIQADTFNEEWDDVTLDMSNVLVSIENTAYLTNSVFCLQNLNIVAGNDFRIPVTFVKNSEISDTVIKLEYDNNSFIFNDIESEFLDVDYTVENSYLIVNISGLENCDNESEIMYFNFKCREYVSGTFDFDLKYDSSLDTEEKSIICNGCSVAVTNPGENEPAILYGNPINGFEGENIKIPVFIKNNNGIMGYKVTISYDEEILSPLNVTAGESFQGNMADNVDIKTGVFDIVWNSNKNVTSDSELFYIEFEVLKCGNTQLNLSYEQADTFNEDWEDVILTCESIQVAIHPSDLIVPKTGSSTIIDKENRLIYGLKAGLNSLDSYIEVFDGYEYTVNGSIATGTSVEIQKDDVVIDTYRVLIFGDVNSDGWYDGMDATIVHCIANGMLNQSDMNELNYMAADCNHDGMINDNDVKLLEKAGLLLSDIRQNEDVVVESGEEYNEYTELINQSGQSEEEKEDSFWNTFIGYLKEIVQKIYNIFISLFYKMIKI